MDGSFVRCCTWVHPSTVFRGLKMEGRGKRKRWRDFLAVELGEEGGT